jgi:hypothetical protein
MFYKEVSNRVSTERIIPLFVLVVIPILILLSEVQYLSLIPPLYSWFEYNKIIRFPVSLTLGEKSVNGVAMQYVKTPINYIHSVLEYILNEEEHKISLYSYYPYHLVSLNVGIPSNNPVHIANCPPRFDECTLTGYTLTIGHHLNSVSVTLLMISLVYSFYPLKYHADDYFKKKGLNQAIHEYEFVKKILYIEIPIFLVLTSIIFAGSYLGLVPIVPSANTPLEQTAFSIAKSLQYALQYSVTAGALWMLFHMIRKEFRYYLARAFIKNMPDCADNVERVHWLDTTLNSYNKYLLRNLKLQIDTSKIYSRLVIESNEKIHEFTWSVSESFDDSDKLTPARRLSKTINLNSEELFLKKSFSAGIITWGTLLATILPVVISVIGLFFHPPNH